MNSAQFNEFPDKIKKDIAAAPLKCPYSKGKVIVSKYKRVAFDMAKALVEKLSFSVGENTSYADLVHQNDKEKELDYSLTHDMVKARAEVGYPYYMDQMKRGTIDVVDILDISHTDPEALKMKLRKAILKINDYIRANHPNIEEKALQYSSLKKELEKKGVRKTINGDNLGIDTLMEETIVTQIIVNTIAYIQYLWEKNCINTKFSLDISTAMPPKFWFFSGSFGGMGANGEVRHTLMHTLYHYYKQSNLQSFFDETTRQGISSEALAMFESNIENIPQNGQHVEHNKRDTFFLSDEANLGCPVMDSFTKFYRITLAALINEE